MNNSYDVIVVGSGAAGLMAALRAADHGMSVLIVEKTSKCGGTTAFSGGVMWIPNHGFDGGDTREETLKYLDSIITDPVRRDKLEAFVDSCPEMLRYVRSKGIRFDPIPWPDYFSESPGARADRSFVFPKYDGARLGKYFPLVREQATRFKLLGRYSIDFGEAFAISMRQSGWIFALLRVVGRYWFDLPTRRKTKRDRRFALGTALVGPFVEQLMKSNVEIRLDTRLDNFTLDGERVSGIEVSRFGKPYRIEARQAVVVCAGGFEWNQSLRARYFEIPGSTKWSSTPENGNCGEALEAGLAIGADTEFTEHGWWVPSMTIPVAAGSATEETHAAFTDVGRPHSVCVNRNGVRFVNETASYDQFGNRMIADQRATGANTPCWMVFDATFREKFSVGGIMPTAITPDRKIPMEWWDHYIFKADTIARLAEMLGISPDALEKTVSNMNDYAHTGIDPEFGRGGNSYDQFFGDARVVPNSSLGPIQKTPFYAVPINLGDLGTKGGLKTDAQSRVLDRNDRPIPGLYAAGNASGSPFGNCYPGAGSTIGPALVFGFRAADDIADRMKGLEHGADNRPCPAAVK